MILSSRSKHFALCLCAFALLWCSCSATSVRKTWKSADLRETPGKIAVVAVTDRGLLRQGFENRFVAQLAKAGTPATVTFEALSLEEIKQDKRAAAAQFEAMGADTVLILRLAGSGASYREVQPGGERYAATISGYEPMLWYDYYSVGFMNMSPTYSSLKQEVDLEASLYDLKTEKRIWSGISKTVIKENTDRVAEMDPVVAKLVGEMRKDGVIQAR